MTVQEALNSKYVNKNGLWVLYKLSDLQYDLKCGCWRLMSMQTMLMHWRAKVMMHVQVAGTAR